MGCWWHWGLALLSACYHLPQIDPNLPLLSCQREPTGKLHHLTPSTQQMLITLLIAGFTNALARLTELKFRSCYRSVMKAHCCALIWQRIGTAIESNSVYCNLQVSASQFLQIPVHLPAHVSLLCCSFPGTNSLAEAAEMLVLVEHCLPWTRSIRVSHQKWLFCWTKTTGRVSLSVPRMGNSTCFCPCSKGGGRVWAGVPGPPGDGEPPEAGDEACAIRAGCCLHQKRDGHR